MIGWLLLVIVDLEVEDDGLDGGDDEENAVPTGPVMPVEATEYRRHKYNPLANIECLRLCHLKMSLVMRICFN